MTEVKKIILGDFDAMTYFEGFKDQSFEKAVEGINDRLLKICKDVGTYDYVGFLTTGKNYRYSVANHARPYKGARPKEKPELLTKLKQYMIDELHCVYNTSLEADDLVAYYKNNMSEETVICSTDKDVLKTVVGTHYNYQWKSFTDKGRFITTTPEEAEEFLWRQAIKGDGVDGIPGLPGVGDKTIDKWFAEKPDNVGFEEFVLSKYIKQLGSAEGICRFSETFRLVYLLKTPEDVMRETGLILDKPVINRLVREI